MHRKRFISIFSFISFLLVVGLFIGAKKIDGTGRPINYRYSNLRSPFDNKTYPVKIPDSLDFSGESVPLYDFDVVERLDKELIVNTYWQSRTLLILKEMKQIGSILRPILKSNGLPDDFIYLAVAESGLQNDVVSPSGATGVWQFVANTGRNYGLQIDDYVDERLNYEKATAAACKYLKESKARFGSWTLAAASYNLGQEGLDRSIKNQKVRSYYDLYLNNETSRYIFRILALKEVMKNPQLYGFHVSTTDLYPSLKYHTVTVDTSINNLTEFAVSEGTTYKYLKVFNPWMINTSLPNKDKKIYSIKIPDPEMVMDEQEVTDPDIIKQQ
ncbi:MAG: lytic transglycosylase domain-containing protein [Bacteroidota bacterium]